MRGTLLEINPTRHRRSSERACARSEKGAVIFAGTEDPNARF